MAKTQPQLNSELFNTLQNDNDERIAASLEAGANPNARDNWGYNPLHYAKDAESVKLLLAAGAKPNARDGRGYAPLHYAKDAESVQLLLAAGADAKAKDCRRGTPLHRAKDAESVKLLLAAGADPKAKDCEDVSSLNYAKDAESVKLLLAAGADPNARDSWGWTPLHRAKNAEIVKSLLDAGADPNTTDFRHRAPLLWAPDAESRELLKFASLVYTIEEQQSSAAKIQNTLKAALEYGITSLCVRLIAAGANIHTKSNSGETTLDMILRTDNPYSMKLLLDSMPVEEQKIIINDVDKDLMPLANFYRSTQCIKMLIEHGAELGVDFSSSTEQEGEESKGDDDSAAAAVTIHSGAGAGAGAGAEAGLYDVILSISSHGDDATDTTDTALGVVPPLGDDANDLS